MATPSGPASGDLGGTYPAPIVTKITGKLSSFNSDTLFGNTLVTIPAAPVNVGLNSSVASTPILANAPGTFYTATVYLYNNTTGDSVGTMLVTLIWTDPTGVQTVSTTAISINGSTFAHTALIQPMLIVANSTISYSSTMTGNADGNGSATLDIVLEQMV